ncbi:MAG: retropepsin-like aspartic protease [Bacteroidota bacterium]
MKCISLSICILLCNILLGQPTAVDSIPFTLTEHNNISIRATVNGIDTLDLMFHTAVNSLSLTEEAVEGLSRLRLDGSVAVQTWGGESNARYSNNHVLQIGKFQWDSVRIWVSKHSGRMTDGKFGPNLFEGSILELNFDHEVLVVHAELPEIDAGYEKLTMLNEQGLLFLEGSLNLGKLQFRNRFLLHSGYSGSVLLDDAFVSEHPALFDLPILKENQLKDSHGNVLTTKQVQVPTLSFGGTSFSDVPVGFFEGAIGRQKMSVLGGDILKRFNIILDMENESIYLIASTLKTGPYADS